MKWVGRSTLVVMSTMAIVATGAATAQAACPVLDPLCVVEEAVDDGVGLVDDTVGGIETPVDDVLDPLEEVVDPVVDTIFGTVDDVIGGGGGEQPEPPEGIGSDDGAQPGVHQGGPGPSGPPGRETVDIVGPRVHERPEIGGVFAPVVAPRPDADATGSPMEGSGRVGVAIGAVARSLAIVLALFGLTLGFAAIQDRLDRNDPRLSLAPIRSDLVTFA
ncbi:MAG TPA: hypothetical protein VF195_09580 [Actinomycetota bacterium]